MNTQEYTAKNSDKIRLEIDTYYEIFKNDELFLVTDNFGTMYHTCTNLVLILGFIEDQKVEEKPCSQ